MKFGFVWAFWLLASALVLIPGCGLSKSQRTVQDDVEQLHYHHAALQIEYPDVDTPFDYENAMAPSPRTIGAEPPSEYWDLTLEEAVQLALTHSKVLRNLGGLVLRSPGSTRTIHDIAIQETDPRFGVAAALSAFDASFASATFVEKNDQQLNNQFFGGGARVLSQDAAVIQSQLTKLAATGTQLSVRNNTEYDANNAPGNLFENGAWNTNIEAEIRHPLLRGGGAEFLRIAGPSTVPGVANGVVIARLNTDLNLTDFEIGVRDFVSNIENAYWDLYFAYRDLDAKIIARDAALDTWRRIHALYMTKRAGGEAEKEAQAREQYFRFQEQVQNALTGRLVDGTRTSNGSSGGTFRGTGGVHIAERRLRLMLGIPISDERLIRPADEPLRAKVIFDWEETLIEALTRRAELRRQKWLVKRREKELIASRNFLLPTVDISGRYRWRGFGRDLLRQHDGPPRTATGEFAKESLNNAVQNLTNGDFQEWQLGLEIGFPLGRRRAHAGVRNAELLLARERTILREQEREIVHDLSNAIAEMDRAYAVVETNYNRRSAAREQLNAVLAAYEADNATLDLLLDGQRRFADAESTYYRSLVEHSLAVKNVHFEKGSLLDYCQVYLSEGMWPVKAYFDAAERRRLRSGELPIDFLLAIPPTVSQGVYPQLVEPDDDAGEAFNAEQNRALPPSPLPFDDRPAAPIPDGAAASAAGIPPQEFHSLSDRFDRIVEIYDGPTLAE